MGGGRADVKKVLKNRAFVGSVPEASRGFYRQRRNADRLIVRRFPEKHTVSFMSA